LEAFRLIHGAADGLAGLEIEAYAGSWLATLESEDWIRAMPALEKALSEVQASIFPKRSGRCHFVANLPERREVLGSVEVETLQVAEDGLRFEVGLGQGPHSGLFLDQRENRRETRRLASGRRCLNLFCYTGSFSIAALAGGAAEVVSVDLSKKALAWLDRNRELNGFAAERCRNRAEDAWDFLAKAAKRGERFDLILLDPPSFGRGPKRSFNLSRDFENLAASAAGLLSPQGDLLVSLNLESLGIAEFRRRLKLALKNFGRSPSRERPLPFDFPPSPGREPHLKSAWV
jgi:23S rRNA (cytosine1962-C5)-methyltransferase